jgi:hypothetical protein
MSTELNVSRLIVSPLRECREPIKAGLLLVITALVFGCHPFVETLNVSPETAARLDNEVRIYQPPELTSLKYTKLRAVESWSCMNLFTDPAPTQEDAVTQMKLKASSLGANGISDLYCSKQGTSLATNCWSSIVCEGTAISVDAK